MPEKPLTTDPEQWVDLYGEQLFRYAVSRVRDRDGAEDVLQETLLAAMKARESFAGNSSEKSWLFGIMKNKIADYFRKKARERTFTESEADNDPTGDFFDKGGHWKSALQPTSWKGNPEKALQEKDFYRVLSQCLEKLPRKHNDAFVLRELEGLESEQICESLGISHSNFYAIMHRARFRLRQCLEMNWFGKK